MHEGACKHGWIDTELREWLKDDYLLELPEELKSNLRLAKKITHDHKGRPFETFDSVFIPSESELFGSAIWSNFEDGPRYEAFDTSASRIRLDEEGDANWYWTRSMSGNFAHFAYVYYTGAASYTSAANTTIRTPLCFMIA